MIGKDPPKASQRSLALWSDPERLDPGDGGGGLRRGGRRRSPKSSPVLPPAGQSIRECIYRAPLDMQTLVWTRGPNFPLSRLESRLMCPECGSRRVSLLFDVPKVPVAATTKRATER